MSGELIRETGGTRLVIHRSARRLYYYPGGREPKTYPVGVGKSSTPTPTGYYSVINKILNPGGVQGGVLGTRWMGLSIPNGNYGIHGNNNPSSIGKFVSNGCIRMYNQDVEELFPKINIGTPVEITDSPGESPPSGGRPAPVDWAGKHAVQKGDTLWRISRLYNVSLDLLISVNNLSNPDSLEPGQVIIIP